MSIILKLGKPGVAGSAEREKRAEGGAPENSRHLKDGQRISHLRLKMNHHREVTDPGQLPQLQEFLASQCQVWGNRLSAKAGHEEGGGMTESPDESLTAATPLP